MFNSHLKKNYSSQSATNLSEKARNTDVSNKFAKLGTSPKANPFASIESAQTTAQVKKQIERNQIEESKDNKTLKCSKFNFAAYLEPNESQKYGATGNESNQLTMINTTGSQHNHSQFA